MNKNAEGLRLDEAGKKNTHWKKWGPFLSERQWGTVREDYSSDGNAWDYFSHDQSRSRAYRWGEDGLAGISDDKQRLCFAIALWNGCDPILKERLFGLTNSEGNHGEDVKEYYYYLDSTPTHSYMKYLYKYPQSPFPYRDLWRTNRERSRSEMEYELIDTGVFDEDKYFDVFVEYAKESPEDLLIKITVYNRAAEEASLSLLPTIWFRNTWSWPEGTARPVMKSIDGVKNCGAIAAAEETLGEMHLYCEGEAELIFTENETNLERIYGMPNIGPYVKDGINDYIVNGRTDAANPKRTGTKASAHYRLKIAPGESAAVRLRLTNLPPSTLTEHYLGGDPFGDRFDEVMRLRLREADEFYDSITPDSVGEDAARVMRQALAGMLWTKQYYCFDLEKWLREHGANLATASKMSRVRNAKWFHMLNDDVISMPDKWEYPWYAAWDLAFHTISLAMVDIDFAKDQLELMLRDFYMHPNGQIPAYEWNFGDVNPPVHAWATLFIYRMEKEIRGKGDIDFLRHAFQKLLMNFTWWVNRKDPSGKNVFEGGFLGLDNIGVFDRSAPLPTGGNLEQADGTAWMALFAQNMFEISLELALHVPTYEELAMKFAEHFFWIASAMDRMGENEDEMWDEEDGFFYDLVRLPSGEAFRLKVRSMVGLLPLCAVTVIPREVAYRFPGLMERGMRFIKRYPQVIANLAPPHKPGIGGRRILAILNEDKLRRILSRMLSEDEFLSPYGIRSLSKHHEKHPYIFKIHGEEYKVAYQPAESDSGMFGGNSNWRGPVWFPVNMLILRALMQFYIYYGNEFLVECPTGSGRMMNLFEVGKEIAGRLAKIFLRDEQGRRPVFGGLKKFQEDPHWRDCLLFYEYFHGDNGAGIGASHQTGWTGLAARIIQMYGYVTADEVLGGGVTRLIKKIYQ